MPTTERQRGPRGSRRRQLHLDFIAARINAGLSREQLAYRCGTSRQTIAGVEQWGIVPGPRIQFALAKEFGKRPLDFWPLDRQKVAAR